MKQREVARAISGERVIRSLERLGYRVIRQKGSHIRLRHDGPPVHLVTVPLHNPLKTGLQSILSEVAGMRSMAIESLAEML